jgi:hypothetical protein
MMFRRICTGIRRKGSLPGHQGGGVNRIQAVFLILLYAAGIVVFPGAHKATVHCNCSSEVAQSSVSTCSGFEKNSVVLAGNVLPHHDPATCPICQLASAPQIAGQSQIIFTSWLIPAGTVSDAERLHPEQFDYDAYLARGPPLIS